VRILVGQLREVLPQRGSLSRMTSPLEFDSCFLGILPKARPEYACQDQHVASAAPEANVPIDAVGQATLKQGYAFNLRCLSQVPVQSSKRQLAAMR